VYAYLFVCGTVAAIRSSIKHIHMHTYTYTHTPTRIHMQNVHKTHTHKHTHTRIHAYTQNACTHIPVQRSAGVYLIALCRNSTHNRKRTSETMCDTLHTYVFNMQAKGGVSDSSTCV